MRKLKVQYDLYFAGIRRVPPAFERGRLDNLMHEMSRVKVREVGLRFKWNMLVSRYNQYRELWMRLGREREEGPLDYRRRLKQLTEADAKIAERLHHEPVPGVTSAEGDTYVKVAGPGDSEALGRLHAVILEAQKAAGRSAVPSLEQIGAMVEKQAETIRSRYGVESIGFRVEIVDGKVKLKAKPLRD
jgi:hypothetical protein